MSLKFIEHVDRCTADSGTDLADSDRRARREEIVRAALSRLGATERYVILRLFYSRDSQAQICRKLRLSLESLDYIRRRALNQLRWLLSAYAEREFGVTLSRPRCPICQSDRYREINTYLSSLDSPVNLEVIAHLRARFRIQLRALRVLSEHINYHRFEEETP